MSKHKGAQKQFYVHTQSWWARSNPLRKDVIEEINVGFYHPDGGTSGEFFFEFVVLHSGHTEMVIPRLRAFDDSWSALVHMPELLQFMLENDNANLTVEQFVDGLKDLGYIDRTDRLGPHAQQQTA